MENINEIEQKVLIEYPTNWCYKIIAMTEDHVSIAISDVICDKIHTLKASNKSKSGKYVSMNLDLIVQNEDERNFIYEALKSHPKTKMIL